MLNGEGLNPSFYTTDLEQYGLALPCAHIFLPYPDSDSLIALFHVTIDTVDQNSTYISTHLYMSILDMDLNGGLGMVTTKNMVLLDGIFSRSGIATVRHANGRDWWVFFHENDSDTFIRFLLTPEGISGPWFQSIGSQRFGGSPIISFSMNGDRALMIDAFSDLDVFDFDRCSGELSNWRHASINDGQWARYGAFSPSGRFAYVSSITKIYQFDLDVASLDGTQLEVALWDSTFDTYPILANYFAEACLAHDGKIYMSTGNATRFMHVIDQPDSLGLACNVQLHAHNRQTYTDNSIPYRPNYYLGPLAGSPCDTLGLGMMEHPPPLNLRAYPNPASGYFVLNYPAQSQVGMLEVRDLSGRIVLHERIPQWSTAHTVDLAEEAGGMYQCEVKWRTRMASVRVIINR